MTDEQLKILKDDEEYYRYKWQEYRKKINEVMKLIAKEEERRRIDNESDESC